MTRQRLILGLLAAGAWAAAAPAAAAPLSGGDYVIATSAVGTGGNQLSGGNFTMITAIGSNDTPMFGGRMSLSPGVLSSVKTARMNLDDAHAFPTPFMPSRGHTSITFTELPVNVEIRIFSISGHLVKVLTKNENTASLVWNPVTNERGTALVSGVYMFTVIQPGISKKHGKIMIIR